MEPVSVDVTIDLPREEVFEYLADIANHPEFMDHFTSEWRLTQVDSYGPGAGARFHIDTRFNRFSWADISFVDVRPPFRILGVGRGGKYNRIRIVSIYTLEPAGGHGTRVTLTTESEPRLPSDRMIEAFARGRIRRSQRKALKRLRSILEEGRERGRRGTIAAGGPRKPASQFRL